MKYYEVIQHLNAIHYRLKNLLYYNYLFGRKGKHSLVIPPLKYNHPENITILDNAVVQKYGWLYCCNVDSHIIIEKNVQIGHFFHCVALKEVHISESVLIADKVFLSDCTHNYADITRSIIESGISHLANVNIGAGSWIGEGVSILGVSIGKHCIIGANSVVTKDIPDYCVVAGNPARIIKKYNADTNFWETVSEEKL